MRPTSRAVSYRLMPALERLRLLSNHAWDEHERLVRYSRGPGYRFSSNAKLAFGRLPSIKLDRS